MATKIAVGVVVALAVVIGFIVFNSSGGSTDQPATTSSAGGVREEDGVQIISMTARGGYSPRLVNAKAGIPTKIEMATNGVYDCSSALSIPALNYRAQLPSTGTTVIDVPAQEKGSTLTGLCAMGMYTFDVRFE
jgi:Cu+-exporting ATPase